MNREILIENNIDYEGGLVRFMNNITLYEGVFKEFMKNCDYKLAKLAYEERDYRTMYSKLKHLAEATSILGITVLYKKIEKVLESAKYENYEEMKSCFKSLDIVYNETIELINSAI